MAIESLEARIAPAVFVWDGGGSDAKWSNPLNWAGDIAPNPDDGTDLVFPAGPSKTATVYDFNTGAGFRSIQFTGAGYSIQSAGSESKGLLVYRDIRATFGSDQAAPATVIGVDLRFRNDTVIENGSSRMLTITGDIDGKQRNLDLIGNKTIRLEGAIVNVPELTLVRGSLEWASDTTFAGNVKLGGNAWMAGTANPGWSGNVQIGLTDSSVAGPELFLHSATDLVGNTVFLKSGQLNLQGQDISLGSLISNGFTSVVKLGDGKLSITQNFHFPEGVLSVGAGAFDGTAPLSVGGAVVLGGTFEGATPASTVPAKYRLIANQGTDLVSGEFANLPERVRRDQLQLTYNAGDGNDVFVLAGTPTVTILGNGRTAIYTDVDGDEVVVRTNGRLVEGNFGTVWSSGTKMRVQVQDFGLGTSFGGSNISFTATPTAKGGDGKVNIGTFLTLEPLTSLKVSGDIGKLIADAPIGRLEAGSLGVKQASTLSPLPAVFPSAAHGGIAELVVARSVKNFILPAVDGNLKDVTIGGNLIDSRISAPTIGKFRVDGDIRSTDASIGTSVSAQRIAKFSVGGSIVGTPLHPVTISADGHSFGDEIPTLGTLSVAKTVKRAVISAGLPGGTNALIGTVFVGGNWIASSLSAAVLPGVDGLFGTPDDKPSDSSFDGKIRSIVIGGTVSGTGAIFDDGFGIVASTIEFASIGGKSLPLNGGVFTPKDLLALARTGTGPNGARSDVYLREVRD